MMLEYSGKLTRIVDEVESVSDDSIQIGETGQPQLMAHLTHRHSSIDSSGRAIVLSDK